MNEDKDLINQTCIKIRLFGDDSLINNENVEDLLDDIADVLVTHGFDNSEIVNSILSVNATDILPLDLDEHNIVDYIVNYEKAAYITLPIISDSEDG
jgi:hypothetical protein